MKRPLRLALVLVGLATAFVLPGRADAAPALVDPNLSVRTVVSGLDQPISVAFLGRNDMLVLEKATGKVQRVVNGTVQSTVLDLAVNSASERGLLGIALDPHFFVNGRVYLYWSETTTGADSAELAEAPLLGNRVDRFYWDGSTLTFDRNIIRLRAFQADAGQPLRAKPRRRRAALRPRQEALRRERRHRAARTASEPDRRSVRPGHRRRPVRRSPSRTTLT